MRMDRRSFTLGAGAGLAATAAIGRAAAQGELEDSVVIRTTGGAFEKALQKHFFDPFTKQTGVRVRPVAASYGEMIAKTVAMAQAGRVEWDIISPQKYELAKLSDYLVDLADCGALPRVAAEGAPGACARYGVQYLSGAVVLTWASAAFPGRKPASWADFWDVKTFPGPRAMPNYGNPWNNALLMALLADGVAPDKLFPLDLDRAFRKLDEIKPHVSVWWKTGSQSTQILQSGEAVMTMLWSGTAYAAKRAGLPIEWTFNQSIADQGSWAILKNSPSPNAARAFIDFYMGHPEAHLGFAREMGYATTNRAAYGMMTPQERAELVPETPPVSIDADWVEKNREAALARWSKWLSA